MPWPYGTYNGWDALSEFANFAGDYLPKYAADQRQQKQRQFENKIQLEQLNMQRQKMNAPKPVDTPNNFTQARLQYANDPAKLAEIDRLEQQSEYAKDPAGYLAKGNLVPGTQGPIQPKMALDNRSIERQILDAYNNGNEKEVTRLLGLKGRIEAASTKPTASKVPKNYAAEVAGVYQKSLAGYNKEKAAAEKYQYIPDPNAPDKPGDTPHGSFGYPTFNQQPPDPEDAWRQSGSESYLPELGLNADSVHTVYQGMTKQPPVDNGGFGGMNTPIIGVNGQPYRRPDQSTTLPTPMQPKAATLPPMPSGWEHGADGWAEYVAAKRKVDPNWQP